MRLIWGDQRAPRQIKSEIESSKDKIFLITHILARSTQAKWYLVQVDMDQLDPIDMRDYGVYRCRWYIRYHKDFTPNCAIEFIIWPETIEIKQDGTLGKMLPVRPLRVNGFLKRYQTYVWYQDEISLDKHSLVVPFQLGTTERKRLK